MFESAELGHAVDKDTYAKEEPELREALLSAQVELLTQKRFPVIVLVSGVDGAGKGETVNLLHEWMDPRHIQTHALGDPTIEEAERPPFWRFWRLLPPKGNIGIFFSSWYTAPIVERTFKATRNVDLDASMDEARRFERMLVAEGALIVKLWLHLSKARQKERLTKLEKNPLTRWRVTDADWRGFAHYDRFRKVSERALRETSTAEAPWTVVEGSDARYRSLTVGRALLAALRARSGSSPAAHAGRVGTEARPSDSLNVIRKMDLSLALPKAAYDEQILEEQARLAMLARSKRYAKRSVIVVFEGADAAGKGGAIRRVTAALDARHYRVVPIAAPTEEERAQPYLWRFWRHVPRRGVLTIFDRSWYGRVLVERVEGFCSADDVERAYAEINDFEDQLVRHRVVVVKLWLQVSAEEQLRRFRERETTSWKRFKITPEDWRNRDKWDAYERAVCDMVDRTSTEIAPWTLVEAEDKLHARVKVLRTIREAIEASL